MHGCYAQHVHNEQNAKVQLETRCFVALARQ